MHFYFSQYPSLPLRNGQSWDFPSKVQWLGLGTLTEGAPSLIPGLGRGVKIQQATQRGQKRKEKKRKLSEGSESLKAESPPPKINYKEQLLIQPRSCLQASVGDKMDSTAGSRQKWAADKAL